MHNNLSTSRKREAICLLFLVLTFLCSCTKEVDSTLLDKKIPLPADWRSWFTNAVNTQYSDTIQFKGALVTIEAQVLKTGKDTSFVEEVSIKLAKKCNSCDFSAGLATMPINMSKGKTIAMDVSGGVTMNESHFGGQSSVTRTFHIHSGNGIEKDK